MSLPLIQELFPGPIDIVGDIHGEIDALRDLLRHLGYERSGIHPQGRRLVFIGDLTDRGPDSPAVIELPALLAHEGFPASVIEAVGALTKRIIDGTEEPYEEFIRRAAQNPIARLVKLADLQDNMDLSRIAQPTEKDHRRVQKYEAAKLVIEDAIAGGA